MKVTKEEFIDRARKIHGDKYDYSKVEYVNISTKVCIICPTHGEFLQLPSSHLRGHGCVKCMMSKQMKRFFYNKAYNDMDVFLTAEHRKAHAVWLDMLRRCYDIEAKKSFHLQVYDGCSVCEEWFTFSNFYKWFKENYVSDYSLDKDILKHGNKVYSPETCCFVPPRINTLVLCENRKNSTLPVGVVREKRRRKYQASLKINGHRRHLGRFKEVKQAFYAYKQAKELYVKQVATEYYFNGKITEKVYHALLNYKVDSPYKD